MFVLLLIGFLFLLLRNNSPSFRALCIVGIFGCLSYFIIHYSVFSYAIQVPKYFSSELFLVLSFYLAGCCIAAPFSLHKKSFLIPRVPALGLFSNTFIIALLATLWVVGSLICLANVGFSFDMLFTESREQEFQFGSNFFAQQLFFQGPLLSCLSIYYCYKLNRARYISAIILILVIVAGLFQGVKFTILDSIALPSIFYISMIGTTRKNQNRKSILNIYLIFSIVGGMLLYLFSFSLLYIRKSGSDLDPLAPFVQMISLISSYIVPNYVNLSYIASNHIPCLDLIVLMPQKLSIIISQDLVNTLSCKTSDFYGWNLSDAYNMPTGLATLLTFSLVSLIVFPTILVFSSRAIYNTMHKLNYQTSPYHPFARSKLRIEFFLLYLYSYILYGSFMMFFYFPFFKEKYIISLFLSLFAIVL